MLTDVTPRKANRARFLESERIRALDLPQDGCLLAIAKSIESAMKEGENADVRNACAEFLAATSEFYRTPNCNVRVLAARPLRVRENWATELFGDAGAEREVLESQIRGFDYVAGVEIDRTGGADTHCRELILIDAGFFHCFACNAGDRHEDLFVIAPSPGFSARAGDNESRGVQYRRHYLSSTQIYSKYVTSHFHDPSSACFNC